MICRFYAVDFVVATGGILLWLCFHQSQLYP